MDRRRAPALAVAAALLVGAGCTGDDGPEAGLTTTTTTAATVDRKTSTTTTTTAPTTTTTVAPVDPLSLRPPPAAADAAALAEQIATAEATLRDDATGEVDVAEAALAQQVAYRALGLHPEWDATVAAALPADLRATAAAHAEVRREIGRMHPRFGDTLPAWRIVPPDPPEDLRAAYDEAEATFGMPWRYLAAIHLVETGMGRIRGTSVAGAQGPMQFMPATWAAYGAGGDINDTRDAILGAGRYLAANNGATDIDNALYRYNHSDHYVRAVKAYADLIAAHPDAFRGFYHWGVWYRTSQGDVWLPVGYEEAAPVPVADYLARR